MIGQSMSDVPGEYHLPANAIRTYKGHIFDITNPDTWVFDLEDIAQALSNLCRFNGHIEFYSVAEHSVRVQKELYLNGYSVLCQMIGLLHDAVEAYIGDIPRPQKKITFLDGEPMGDFEKGLEYALFQAYGFLDADFDYYWEKVKEADLAVYLDEASERPRVGRGLSPTQAHIEFMATFERLKQLIG